MRESTLFWGLLAASLTNVLFLCVYLWKDWQPRLNSNQGPSA